MNTQEIKNGTKIIANGLVMIVTGENEKSYIGYNEYKGKNVGACLLYKDMFTNPHYMNSIQIIDQDAI